MLAYSLKLDKNKIYQHQQREHLFSLFNIVKVRNNLFRQNDIPPMTSSFFINKEKSQDLKLEDILPQSQLPSNKKIDVLAKAIHNIILSNGNDYDLMEEQKNLLIKSNNDVNESH